MIWRDVSRGLEVTKILALKKHNGNFDGKTFYSLGKLLKS